MFISYIPPLIPDIRMYQHVSNNGVIRHVLSVTKIKFQVLDCLSVSCVQSGNTKVIQPSLFRWRLTDVVRAVFFPKIYCVQHNRAIAEEREIKQLDQRLDWEEKSHKAKRFFTAQRLCGTNIDIDLWTDR
jgi:hypothetical protein